MDLNTSSQTQNVSGNGNNSSNNNSGKSAQGYIFTMQKFPGICVCKNNSIGIDPADYMCKKVYLLGFS